MNPAPIRLPCLTAVAGYIHYPPPNPIWIWMKVLLVSDPDTDKASAALDTRVGAMSDPEDTQVL